MTVCGVEGRPQSLPVSLRRILRGAAALWMKTTLATKYEVFQSTREDLL